MIAWPDPKETAKETRHFTPLVLMKNAGWMGFWRRKKGWDFKFAICDWKGQVLSDCQFSI
jgi:hypothetical protein